MSLKEIVDDRLEITTQGSFSTIEIDNFCEMLVINHFGDDFSDHYSLDADETKQLIGFLQAKLKKMESE